MVIVPLTAFDEVNFPWTIAVVMVVVDPGSICFDVAVNVPIGSTVIDLIVASADGSPYGSVPTGKAPVPKHPGVPNWNFLSVWPMVAALKVTMSSKPLMALSEVVPANAPWVGSTAPATAAKTRVDVTASVIASLRIRSSRVVRHGRQFAAREHDSSA